MLDKNFDIYVDLLGDFLKDFSQCMQIELQGLYKQVITDPYEFKALQEAMKREFPVDPTRTIMRVNTESVLDFLNEYLIQKQVDAMVMEGLLSISLNESGEPVYSLSNQD